MMRSALCIMAATFVAGCAGKPNVSSKEQSLVLSNIFSMISSGRAQDVSNLVNVPYGIERPCQISRRDSNGSLRIRQQFACIINRSHREYKEKYKEEYKEKPNLRLLFYFNGGLNTAETSASFAISTFEQVKNSDFYPIYMIWPTGLWDSYFEDVLYIRNGQHVKEPLYATAPVQPFVGDVLRGLGSTPDAWKNAVAEWYRTGFGRGSSEYFLSRLDSDLLNRGQAVNSDYNVLFDQQNADLPRKPGGSSAERYWWDQIRSIATAPFRPFSAPIIAGHGSSAWANMVRRTRTSIREVNEYNPSGALDKTDPEVASRSERQELFPRGTGAFARFFQMIQSCISTETSQKESTSARAQQEKAKTGVQKCPDTLNLVSRGPESGEPEISETGEPLRPEPITPEAREALRNVRITLVGHSMGAIVINELLEAFPDLPYENIVYMGGAASVRDTARAINPVLEANKGCTRFYNLMLHPMNESREQRGGGFVHSGSLPVWVDELLQDPETLPDRTIGQWRNVRATKHLFREEAQKYILFRIFDRDARTGEPNPREHSGFNDPGMPWWSESFWGADKVSFEVKGEKREQACKDRFSKAELIDKANRSVQSR